MFRNGRRRAKEKMRKYLYGKTIGMKRLLIAPSPNNSKRNSLVMDTPYKQIVVYFSPYSLITNSIDIPTSYIYLFTSTACISIQSIDKYLFIRNSFNGSQLKGHVDEVITRNNDDDNTTKNTR